MYGTVVVLHWQPCCLYCNVTKVNKERPQQAAVPLLNRIELHAGVFHDIMLAMRMGAVPK